MGVGALRTYPVIRHGAADIFDHIVKLIRILDFVREPCDLSSPCRGNEVSENIIQFPSKSYMSD